MVSMELVPSGHAGFPISKTVRRLWCTLYDKYYTFLILRNWKISYGLRGWFSFWGHINFQNSLMWLTVFKSSNEQLYTLILISLDNLWWTSHYNQQQTLLEALSLGKCLTTWFQQDNAISDTPHIDLAYMEPFVTCSWHHRDHSLTELAAQVCRLIFHMLLHITLIWIILSHLVKSYVTQHKNKRNQRSTNLPKI